MPEAHIRIALVRRLWCVFGTYCQLTSPTLNALSLLMYSPRPSHTEVIPVSAGKEITHKSKAWLSVTCLSNRSRAKGNHPYRLNNPEKIFQTLTLMLTK